MTERQKSFHRYSAVSMLCVSVLVFFCMSFVAIHAKRPRDAQGMAGVSALACVFFTLWLIYCWLVGSVSIRSVTIERKSELKTYRLAMLGFLILDLAFLASVVLNLYVLHRHAA